MEPYQQRVVDEKAALDEKRESLRAFTSTTTFHALPESDQSLLLTQQVAMRNYSDVLGQRITRFKDKDE